MTDEQYKNLLDLLKTLNKNISEIKYEMGLISSNMSSLASADQVEEVDQAVKKLKKEIQKLL